MYRLKSLVTVTVHEWDESTVDSAVFLQLSKYLCHVCRLGHLRLGLENLQVTCLLPAQLETQQSSLISPLLHEYIHLI